MTGISPAMNMDPRLIESIARTAARAAHQRWRGVRTLLSARAVGDRCGNALHACERVSVTSGARCVACGGWSVTRCSTRGGVVGGEAESPCERLHVLQRQPVNPCPAPGRCRVIGRVLRDEIHLILMPLHHAEPIPRPLEPDAVGDRELPAVIVGEFSDHQCRRGQCTRRSSRRTSSACDQRNRGETRRDSPPLE